jgi:AmmeMemoRadiSam system protein B
MSDSNAFRGTPIRRSPIAGSWYPGDPGSLERTVRDMISASEAVEVSEDLVALISPHAGLPYSGPVAAAGYRLLERNRFDTVVLIGPSHFVPVRGASIYSRGAFETPLGLVPVDEELAGSIEDREPRIRFFADAHDREHSLEMQLPFLQVLAPGLSIVPIVMGGQRRDNVDILARAVGNAVAESPKRVLLIASSDLSHFKSADEAAGLDGQVSRLIEDYDSEGLMDLLDRNHEHACGGGPIVAILEAARYLGAKTTRIMRYGNSGDITGDTSQVVGYLSAAVFQ